MAAVFAAAILLAAGMIAAGLILFPVSERKAQANPCSVEEQGAGPYGDVDLDLDCEFDE